MLREPYIQQTTRLYEFGAFRLNAAEGVLSADGCAVKLTPKAVQTLALLIARRGHVVSKQEFFEKIWGETFVEDAALTFHISQLRKTLAEFDAQTKFIETVPKRGFRFLPEVREITVEPPRGEMIFERRTIEEILVEEIIETDQNANLSVVESPATIPARQIARTKQAVRRSTVYLFGSAFIILLLTAGFAVWRWNQSAATANLAQIKSIAVLPLKPIAANEADKALSLGLADALIMRLGSAQETVVRPLSSITQYAGIEYDALEIGRKMPVDAVLEGSFQRIENRLSVRLKLLRVADNKQIWAGTFTETETDLFKLQDIISTEASTSLALHLNSLRRDFAVKRYTENVEAYQAYLRGRLFSGKRDEDKENFNRAVAEYEHALRLDPNYAMAYAGLADAYSHQANISSGEKRKQLYENSKTAAQTAVSLDDNLAEAHASLGWTNRIYDWNWAESEKHLTKAIELAPHEAGFRRRYVFLLITLGRTAEAVEQARKAVEIEPVNIAIHGLALSADRQYDAAIAEYKKVIEANQDQTAWRNLAGLYLRQGKVDEAVEIYNQTPEKEKEDNRTRVIAMQIFYASGDREKAFEILRQMEADTQTEDGRDARLAADYAFLGMNDKAIAALQKALETRDDRLVWIKTNSNFDGLRDDPRFQEILRKMNLPQN